VRPSLLVVLAALCLGSVGVAHAASFAIKPGGATRVVFVSKAPTETFEGRTDRMTGTLTLDPAAIGDSIGVHLVVDVTTLDTGSKLRDRHMHERYLETARFGTAVFDGGAVVAGAGSALRTGAPSTFQVDGTFTLHGVSRRQRCTVQASLTKDGAVSFVATFPVNLVDHAIERPEMLFLKLAETQQVRVSAIASSPRP